MWWIRTKANGEDRNGFQNRDVGRRSHDYNFGPDFGVDYARFSDSPNVVLDYEIRQILINKIRKKFNRKASISLEVRNGFVIIKGVVRNDQIKKSLLTSLYSTPGVVEVISDLSILKNTVQDRKINHEEVMMGSYFLNNSENKINSTPSNNQPDKKKSNNTEINTAGPATTTEVDLDRDNEQTIPDKNEGDKD